MLEVVVMVQCVQLILVWMELLILVAEVVVPQLDVKVVALVVQVS